MAGKVAANTEVPPCSSAAPAGVVPFGVSLLKLPGRPIPDHWCVMNPLELYRAGRLTDAIKALSAELRDNPTDTRRRTFLFELLCFAGEYERADKQLEVLAQAGPSSEMGVLLYRSALYAERQRHDLFERGEFPAEKDDSEASREEWPTAILSPSSRMRIRERVPGSKCLPQEIISCCRWSMWRPSRFLLRNGSEIFCGHPLPSVRLHRSKERNWEKS